MDYENEVAVIPLKSYPSFMSALEDLKLTMGDMRPKFLELVGPKSKYVDRPVLEAEILRFSMSRLNDKIGVYIVLVGPKGAGKSTILAKVLEEKKGVINILVSQADTPEMFLRRLLLSCGKIVEEEALVGLEVLIPILRSVAEKRNDLPITFTIEVVLKRNIFDCQFN
jgi:ATP/maltotriose-dependent transcriptional regulator MalT